MVEAFTVFVTTNVPVLSPSHAALMKNLVLGIKVVQVRKLVGKAVHGRNNFLNPFPLLVNERCLHNFFFYE